MNFLLELYDHPCQPAFLNSITHLQNSIKVNKISKCQHKKVSLFKHPVQLSVLCVVSFCDNLFLNSITHDTWSMCLQVTSSAKASSQTAVQLRATDLSN